MLEVYRQQIDSIDTQILNLLAERAQIVQKIGAYKQENNIPVFQPKRWEQILEVRKEEAIKLGLSPIYIQDLRNRIHQESLSLQQKNG